MGARYFLAVGFFTFWAVGCEDRPAAVVGKSSEAIVASEQEALDSAVPNPVYPIEVSIAGNAALQEAAAAAEARSLALDEVCKGLALASEVAAAAPRDGGCPRIPEIAAAEEGP